jgi:hypothetical protein
MNEFERLQAWYLSQCDGDWEHDGGVSITTLDNPGWSVDINLEGTALQDRTFISIEHGLNPDAPDWVICKVNKNVFMGRGGPTNLVEILGHFLDWAEKNSLAV